MVQLRLEPLGQGGIPKDCYVSVRIGETQKLSRLGGARSYKFPKTDKTRFGKLEVYRRVGAVGIDLEKAKGGTHDLSISCTDKTLGDLSLRLCMDGTVADDPVPAKESAGKANSSKVQAAQEYLAKHSLEFQLAEAMQALLRELPEDPVEFLSSQLKLGPKPLVGDKKSRSKFAKQAAAKQAPAAEQKPKPSPGKKEAKLLPFAEYYKENMTAGTGGGGLSKLYSKFEAKKGVTFSSKQEAPVPPQDQMGAPLQSVGDYYKDHMIAPSSGLMQSLYSKFLTEAPAEKGTSSLLPFAPYYEEHLAVASSGGLNSLYAKFGAGPAAAKKAAPSKPAAPATFGEYYKQNLVGASNDGSKSLFAKFPAYAAAVKAAAPLPSAAAVERPLHFQPSVGTWLMAKPKPIVTKAAAAASVTPPPQSQAASRPKLTLMPSAATWMASKPAPVWRPKTTAVRHLRGLQAPGMTTWDERCEVERVLTKALLELTGEFEGEYFPLASSTSYPAMPGGMTDTEERELASNTLLFKSKCTDVSGQGVFTNNARDVAAWLNESGHVRLLVLQTGAEADFKLGAFESAVAMALKQDGYDLA